MLSLFLLFFFLSFSFSEGTYMLQISARKENLYLKTECDAVEVGRSVCSEVEDFTVLCV